MSCLQIVLHFKLRRQLCKNSQQFSPQIVSVMCSLVSPHSRARPLRLWLMYLSCLHLCTFTASLNSSGCNYSRSCIRTREAKETGVHPSLSLVRSPCLTTHRQNNFGIDITHSLAPYLNINFYKSTSNLKTITLI